MKRIIFLTSFVVLSCCRPSTESGSDESEASPEEAVAPEARPQIEPSATPSLAELPPLTSPPRIFVSSSPCEVSDGHLAAEMGRIYAAKSTDGFLYINREEQGYQIVRWVLDMDAEGGCIMTPETNFGENGELREIGIGLGVTDNYMVTHGLVDIDVRDPAGGLVYSCSGFWGPTFEDAEAPNTLLTENDEGMLRIQLGSADCTVETLWERSEASRFVEWDTWESGAWGTVREDEDAASIVFRDEHGGELRRHDGYPRQGFDDGGIQDVVTLGSFGIVLDASANALLLFDSVGELSQTLSLDSITEGLGGRVKLKQLTAVTDRSALLLVEVRDDAYQVTHMGLRVDLR